MSPIKSFWLCLTFSWFVISITYTNPSPHTVNILTWFGYLNSLEVTKLVDENCHTNLPFDEYYSNGEFLRRWKAGKDNYDIVVFANFLYDGIKNTVSRKDIHLSSLTKD